MDVTTKLMMLSPLTIAVSKTLQESKNISTQINQLSDMFAINTISSFLYNRRLFDRESEIFSGHLLPQITIRLNLICNSLISAALGADNVTAFSGNAMLDEIVFSKTVTYLNIVIVDINDNTPTFDTSGIIMGFPDAELATKLMPPNLIQVEAVDLDEGLNAKIRYSVEGSIDFTINPQTGVIYPLKDCLVGKTSTEVSVKATDRDGAAGGRVGYMSIDVLKLTAQNIVTLTVENEDLDNIPNVLKEISEKTNFDIRAVNYFAVPADEGLQGKQNAVSTKIVIFVYGISIGPNALRTGQEIIKRLDEAVIIFDVVAAPYSENPSKPSDCNLTGLIIAVSILGSFLLIISVSAPLLWFFWLRYKMNGSRRFSESSVKKLEEDFNEDFAGRSSPVATSSDDIDYAEPVDRMPSDAEIVGIEIDGATEGLSCIAYLNSAETQTFNSSRKHIGLHKAQRQTYCVP